MGITQDDSGKQNGHKHRGGSLTWHWAFWMHLNEGYPCAATWRDNTSLFGNRFQDFLFSWYH